MNPIEQELLYRTRRQFFGDVGLRFGGLALAMLMGQTARSAVASPTSGGTTSKAVERVHRQYRRELVPVKQTPAPYTKPRR